MANVVTCAACGARIRADRERCLRCAAPLVATAEPVRAQPLSQGQRLMLAAGGSLIALLVIAFAWANRPQPLSNEAQAYVPPPGAAAPVAPPAPAAPVNPVVDGAGTPGALLDLSRQGTAAFLTGDLQKAREQFETALEQKPDDPEVLNSIGQILDRQGDVPGAIERFEKAVALAPGKWAYHFNLAHAAGRLNDWPRAADEYREAARLFPEDYATQFNLGLALHRMGNAQAAVPELERAIQLAPAEASFHLALGNSLQAAGRLPEARKAFETYLDMEPSAPDAAKVKAHVAALAGASSAPSQPGS